MSDACSLIFDLDGTLIDSVPDLRAAVNRMLAAEGQPEMPRAEVQSYVGDGARVLVRRVMEARGIDLARHPRMAEDFIADYTANATDETEIFPGAVAALGALQARGHRMGICTNKPYAATSAILRQLGLAGFFQIVIAGDTLSQHKPHPAPLLAARRALGAPALYIGDSEVDAQTAAAAGIPFVFFTEGYLRLPLDRIDPAARFSDYAELPALIAGLDAAG